MTAADACLRMYSRKRVVSYYSNFAALEKPEATILHALAGRLGSMRMLDVGVGGGRVTEHVASRVAHYRGIDISPQMVETCRRRFAGRLAPERFEVRDMRALDAFPTHAFDFVLNAFNGIDHLTHAERGAFLAQVRRVLEPGGVFCFSTHNILSLAGYLRGPDWTRPEFWRRPLAALRALRHRARLLRLNREILARHAIADHVVVNNGAHDDFGVGIYYVRTGAQLEALRRAGFERIQVYSLDTGEELTGGRIEAAADRWLYYVCS
jgi:SAM-dependent methyltransferase